MARSSSPSKHTKLCVSTTYRREVGGAVVRSGASISPEQVVISDLPAKLSPTKDELALWRAFLADEIDAILRDGG